MNELWRAAVLTDVAALTDLEQAANEAAIGHLFAGLPFPREEVADLWRAHVTAPEASVEVVDAPDGGLHAFCCVRGARLEHLAVHPAAWGRGLARAGVARAATTISARGAEPVLWCLAENERARGLYEHLGWELSGRTTTSRYPPYRTEVEYVLRSVGAR